MIVNYSPALSGAAKNQRKPSVRLIVSSLQLPATNRHRSIIAYDAGFEIGKRQCPHFLTRVVIFLVAIVHGLPTAREGIAGNKCDISGASVAIHVALKVASIPSISLCVKHGPHGGNGDRITF